MLLTITEFIGHLHPALVHLPIGILLIALFLIWLSGKKQYNISPSVISIVLLIGAISAAASCITGYILSLSDDYESNQVSWHMWMGIGVASCWWIARFAPITCCSCTGPATLMNQSSSAAFATFSSANCRMADGTFTTVARVK